MLPGCVFSHGAVRPIGHGHPCRRTATVWPGGTWWAPVREEPDALTQRVTRCRATPCGSPFTGAMAASPGHGAVCPPGVSRVGLDADGSTDRALPVAGIWSATDDCAAQVGRTRTGWIAHGDPRSGSGRHQAAPRDRDRGARWDRSALKVSMDTDSAGLKGYACRLCTTVLLVLVGVVGHRPGGRRCRGTRGGDCGAFLAAADRCELGSQRCRWTVRTGRSERALRSGEWWCPDQRAGR